MQQMPKQRRILSGYEIFILKILLQSSIDEWILTHIICLELFPVESIHTGGNEKRFPGFTPLDP